MIHLLPHAPSGPSSLPYRWFFHRIFLTHAPVYCTHSHILLMARVQEVFSHRKLLKGGEGESGGGISTGISTAPGVSTDDKGMHSPELGDDNGAHAPEAGDDHGAHAPGSGEDKGSPSSPKASPPKASPLKASPPKASPPKSSPPKSPHREDKGKSPRRSPKPSPSPKRKHKEDKKRG